jgi:hypothetical protein
MTDEELQVIKVYRVPNGLLWGLRHSEHSVYANAAATCIESLVADRDELLAEVERLRAEIKVLGVANAGQRNLLRYVKKIEIK